MKPKNALILALSAATLLYSCSKPNLNDIKQVIPKTAESTSVVAESKKLTLEEMFHDELTNEITNSLFTNEDYVPLLRLIAARDIISDNFFKASNSKFYNTEMTVADFQKLLQSILSVPHCGLLKESDTSEIVYYSSMFKDELGLTCFPGIKNDYIARKGGILTDGAQEDVSRFDTLKMGWENAKNSNSIDKYLETEVPNNILSKRKEILYEYLRFGISPWYSYQTQNSSVTSDIILQEFPSKDRTLDEIYFKRLSNIERNNDLVKEEVATKVVLNILSNTDNRNSKLYGTEMTAEDFLRLVASVLSLPECGIIKPSKDITEEIRNEALGMDISSYKHGAELIEYVGLKQDYIALKGNRLSSSAKDDIAMFDKLKKGWDKAFNDMIMDHSKWESQDVFLKRYIESNVPDNTNDTRKFCLKYYLLDVCLPLTLPTSFRYYGEKK